MPPTTHQRSNAYGLIQSMLLCVFAGTIFFTPDAPLLLTGRVPGVVGSVLCAAGLLLLLIAFVWIRRAIQIAPEPRAGARLVTGGVYRYFRHPIYTAIVLLVIGLFLRKPTLVTAIAAAVVIVFLVVKVKFEEGLLLARYPEYAEYKDRTWGVVPWPHRSANR